MTRRCPRHSARRCATAPTRGTGGSARISARCSQNTSSGRSTTAAAPAGCQLAEHPAQLWPGEADVGEGVFAQRRDRLGPAQEPRNAARRSGSSRARPARGLRAALRRRCCRSPGPCPRRRGRTAACRSAVPGRPPGPGPRNRGCRRCARAGPGAAGTGRTTPATSRRRRRRVGRQRRSPRRAPATPAQRIRQRRLVRVQAARS